MKYVLGFIAVLVALGFTIPTPKDAKPVKTGHVASIKVSR